MDNKSLNIGTVEIEIHRAIAEAQGKLTLAKKFPRDPEQALADMIAACTNKALAEVAFYSYPRGGENVTGPSIRFAEELARCWGNIDYGIRELSSSANETEYEAYAWDMQTNTISSQKFTVKHERHTKSGVKKLTDPRDIYEVGANNAARRLRARIMAVIPKAFQDAAINQCELTLKSGGIEPGRLVAMITKFGSMGITPDMIAKRIGSSVDAISGDKFAELIGIFNSIRDGISHPSAYFPDIPEPAKPEPPAIIQAMAAKPETDKPLEPEIKQKQNPPFDI